MAGKLAYVTGGMGGIGTTMCQRLYRDGFVVVAGCGPSRDSDKWLAEQKALGFEFHASMGNVGDWDSTVRAFEKVQQELGPVDVLVNNAGIGSAAPMELMPMDEIRAVFETNVFGAVRMMQAVLPTMRIRRQGVIVNVTSMMGRVTLPCHGSYAATKFALAAISESLAMEMKPFNVRVAIIEPGVILTPIWHKRTVALPEGHEYGFAMRRLMRVFGSQMEGGTLPDAVAAAIFDAATRPDSPLRIPVGADAEALAAGRDNMSVDDWVSLYAEPDEEAFVARSEQAFGVDTLLNRWVTIDSSPRSAVTG